MCKRAGHRRKTIEQRKIEIYNVVGLQTVSKNGYATVYSIARELQMTPSTHLYRLCHQLVAEDRIDMLYKPSSNPVYRFYFSSERIEKTKRLCELPYICTPPTSGDRHICSDSEGRLCVISFMYSAYI